jgi:FkbM family methyltransferase
MQIQKGYKIKDKLILFFVIRIFLPLRELLKKHPNSFRKVFGIFNTDICIKIKTKRGPARLVVNITDPDEVVILKEIVINGNYKLSESHNLLIDVGAFRGISTIFLADQISTINVLAVEPEEENFRILKKRLNKYLPFASLIQAALGKKTGYFGFSGKGVSGKLNDSGPKVFTISCDKLNLCPASDSAVVKIDIEGGEEDILLPFLSYLPQQCLLLLETHRGYSQGLKLLKTYQDKGFKIETSNNKDGPYIDWRLWRC